MNVLILGSGGREHALAWKIAQSPQVGRLYCAPGNPGIAQVAECVPLGVNDFEGLIAFAKEHAVELTVVGPEDPLARGITDRFAEAGLTVFGPTAAAARLESSKVFAKEFLLRHGIPTAAYAEFDDADAAVAYIEEHGAPLVVKADGLAAGKGVVVAMDTAAAVSAVREMMVGRVFGDAGAKVVVEECLFGEEASILAFSDGTTVVPMVASQDHKPVFDGDQGPNTGGMGAYSPAPVVTDALMEEITRTIVAPAVAGMRADGTPYVGVLYAGLMMTASGPKVIEFNCRFGDPETQVVLPRMKTDLVTVLLACCRGELATAPLEWQDGACVSVVMASGGYPKDYEKGKVITGIDVAEALPGVTVFHAGTQMRDGAVVTNGGRVLNVTATGGSVREAIDMAYAAVERIQFEGAHFRRDIGGKALKRLGL